MSISIHGLGDLIALSETPLTRIVSPLITDGWISAIIILLIPLVVALLMMTGKRKTFMGENVGRIIAVS